jgi:hypothetical protein
MNEPLESGKGLSMQAITLHLPENVYQRLQLMAQATHMPLEEVVSQAIQGNLPPLVDDLPDDWRNDLAELPSFSDQALWLVTKESLPEAQWQRHQQLLEGNQVDGLTEAEQEELTRLRIITDRFVFRRSYALALLKWRGYTLPIPDPFPAP